MPAKYFTIASYWQDSYYADPPSEPADEEKASEEFVIWEAFRKGLEPDEILQEVIDTRRFALELEEEDREIARARAEVWRGVEVEGRVLMESAARERREGGGAGGGAETFEAFGRLPGEIRRRVWDLAILAENEGGKGQGKWFGNFNPPWQIEPGRWMYTAVYSVVAVCRESRILALQAWKLAVREMGRDRDGQRWENYSEERIYIWVKWEVVLDELVEATREGRGPRWPCEKFWYDGAKIKERMWTLDHRGCCLELRREWSAEEELLKWERRDRERAAMRGGERGRGRGGSRGGAAARGALHGLSTGGDLEA